jgi:hypothetical protein
MQHACANARTARLFVARRTKINLHRQIFSENFLYALLSLDEALR